MCSIICFIFVYLFPLVYVFIIALLREKVNVQVAQRFAEKFVEFGYFAQKPAFSPMGGRPIISHRKPNVNRQNTQKNRTNLVRFCIFF